MNTHNLLTELKGGVSELATAVGTTGTNIADETNAGDFHVDSEEADKEEIVLETSAAIDEDVTRSPQDVEPVRLSSNYMLDSGVLEGEGLVAEEMRQEVQERTLGFRNQRERKNSAAKANASRGQKGKAMAEEEEDLHERADMRAR
jgi:hypothetical protein